MGTKTAAVSASVLSTIFDISAFTQVQHDELVVWRRCKQSPSLCSL